jgi:ketosteroid isomerase-like protein
MSPATLADSMRKTNQIFETEVVRKRNYDALNQVYTVDAHILPPGAPMVAGRQAIIEFWKAALEGMNVQDGHLETVSVIEGGYPVEIGRAELVFQNGSRADVKYVVAWKLEDSSWKWHVDIWNMNS